MQKKRENTQLLQNKFNVLDYSTVCFDLSLLKLQTWFKLSRVKLYRKWPERKRKLLRVSGRFELSRVRVTEGKITVNVWRKTRSILVRVSARFELVRVRVIGTVRTKLTRVQYAKKVGEKNLKEQRYLEFAKTETDYDPSIADASHPRI